MHKDQYRSADKRRKAPLVLVGVYQRGGGRGWSRYTINTPVLHCCCRGAAVVRYQPTTTNNRRRHCLSDALKFGIHSRLQ